RTALSVLLFQDIAVIPLLAAVPLLAGAGADAGGPSAVAMAAVVVGVIVFGRFLVQPTFDLVAQWGNQDVFTAASLLLVVGTAALMEFVGLSMALGAFIAGVLFADSHHRHAVIADIEPFKGLLMGLFFIAVGMTVDLALLVERPGLVAALALGLVAGKAVVLIVFGWLSRLPPRAVLRFTASLAQGGEFAFVIFSAALGFSVVARETVDLMILIVAISMMLTPLLFRAAEAFDRPRPPDAVAAPEGFTEAASPVIIAGFGRMGQIVARALRLSDTRFTALDNDLEQISFVSRFGDKAFFGDATRPHILRAAGAATAKVFVICVNDVAISIKIAETVRGLYPELFVIARVRNRHHAYRMLELGVHKVVRETFAGSLDIAESALVETGQSPSRAGAMVSRFKD
ncbi:MAG: cation:proton antiporter, partial [Thalassobaculaceae bacterium]